MGTFWVGLLRLQVRHCSTLSCTPCPNRGPIRSRSEGSPATGQFHTSTHGEEACWAATHLQTDDVRTSGQRLTWPAQRRWERSTGTGSYEVGIWYVEYKEKQYFEPRFLVFDWFKANVYVCFKPIKNQESGLAALFFFVVHIPHTSLFLLLSPSAVAQAR